MKQTLLVIALFIGLGNVNPQDASNDATWEETISFLKKYKNDFKVVDAHPSWCEQMELEITEDKIRYYGAISDYKCEYSIDLTKLKSVGGNSPSIILYTTGNNCLKYNCRVDNGKSKSCMGNHDGVTNSLMLWIDDIEMHPRFVSAFEHLVKLATKKREDVRKASGDKF